MVFSIRFQVIQVNVWKPRDQQLEFLFVEDGNQTFGNDVVKTFQKGVKLVSDCSGHFHLAHSLYVLFLVFFRYSDVLAIFYQFADF